MKRSMFVSTSPGQEEILSQGVCRSSWLNCSVFLGDEFRLLNRCLVTSVHKKGAPDRELRNLGSCHYVFKQNLHLLVLQPKSNPRSPPQELSVLVLAQGQINRCLRQQEAWCESVQGTVSIGIEISRQQGYRILLRVSPSQGSAAHRTGQ